MRPKEDLSKPFITNNERTWELVLRNSGSMTTVSSSLSNMTVALRKRRQLSCMNNAGFVESGRTFISHGVALDVGFKL